ncbi:hypothetical protein SDJN03_03900, partial [Cucurbita argyrosperma subsp. sororia]
MDSKTFHCPLLPVLVFSLLVVSSICRPDKNIHPNNHTAVFWSENQLKKLKLIQADLNRINKFPVKTIKSPDGDFIDCVKTHRQLAFDHPLLKGKKPLVNPELYGDNNLRLFTYWTSDAYQVTGCYNLLCPSFVQTNRRIAIGAAIAPTSSYNGAQFDISLLVWKDPKNGNWWLEFGSGVMVGYWPAFLFTHLQSHATTIQFGGEVVNSRAWGFHTATEMGSGHFAGQGF